MNRRKGFSLIELLVVMTIMAIVLGLIFRATLGTMGNARQSSTRTTIAKLDSMLEQRLAEMRKKPLRDAAKWFTAAYNGGGNPSPYATTTDAVSEVIVRKLAYRSMFPQRLEDLYGLDGTPNTADDALLLSVWLGKTGGVLRPAGHSLAHESSKLLYLALTNGRKQSDMDSVNARHLKFLDPGDEAAGLYSIVDDWGNALRFYNWPTRLIRPGGPGAAIDQGVFSQTAAQLVTVEIPTTPQPYPFPTATNGLAGNAINQDGDDPRMVFLLQSPQFDRTFQLFQWLPGYQRSPAVGTSTVTVTAVPLNELTLHTLQTIHRPLIMSCGEDGQLGIEEPTATGAVRLAMPKSGYEYETVDNITNQQPRI